MTPRDNLLGLMDLGTNSVRLLLARISPDNHYTIISTQKETIRLGEGCFRDGLLDEDAIRRAVRTCTQFAAMARANGVDRLIAVATAACREAENRVELLDLLAEEANLVVRVIPGVEEARLIWLGVASGLRLDEAPVLFIDIGGGSTEVIWGNQQTHRFLDSLRLGAIRLTNDIFAPGFDGPVSDAQYELLCQIVRNRAYRAIRELRDQGIEIAIGSSGTINKLADVTSQRIRGRNLGPDEFVSREEVGDTIRWLRQMTLQERRNVPGLNPARADIIVAGASILETLMAEIGIERLRSSDRGLREGLLLDFLSRESHPQPWDPASLRERSVRQLAEACRYEEAHARHVAGLADMLFTSGAAAGLHNLGSHERELLHYASYLHDIGMFVRYSGHHLHSEYLIRNAELLGFDQTEIDVIALTARFHQKGFPRLGHAALHDLERSWRDRVIVLSTMLRLAECLDRTHAGRVQSVAFVTSNGNGSVASSDRPANATSKATPEDHDPLNTGDGVVTLRIVANGDWRLEARALEGQLKHGRRAFGREMRIEEQPI